jgi:hypothetical protein
LRQSIYEVLTHPNFHAQSNIWTRLFELREQPRQERLAKVLHHANPEDTSDVWLCNSFHDLLIERKQPTGIAKQ